MRQITDPGLLAFYRRTERRVTHIGLCMTAVTLGAFLYTWSLWSLGLLLFPVLLDLLLLDFRYRISRYGVQGLRYEERRTIARWLLAHREYPFPHELHDHY